METSRSGQSNKTVHIAFGLTLLFLVMTRYALYFRNGTSGEAADIERMLGASFGYFLTWAFGYYLCLTAPRKKTVTVLGSAAVILGPLTAPFVGYLLITIIYYVRKRQLQEWQASGGEPAGPAQKEEKRARSKPLIYPFLDPRTPTGLVALIFWMSFVAFVFTPNPILAAILALLLVLSILVRLFPIKAAILHSQVLRWFTWGKTREVNELFGLLPSLGHMDPAGLAKLLTRKNELVRHTALEELRERGSRNKETAAILVKLASSSPGESLPEIIQALGRTGDAGDIPAILPFLGDLSCPVRGAAAECLAEIGSQEVVPAIADAFLREQDHACRKSMFIALQNLDGFGVLASRWQEMPTDAKVLCLRSARDAVVSGKASAEAFFALAEKDPADLVRKAWREARRDYLLAKTQKDFPSLFEREARKRRATDGVVLGKMVALGERLQALCGAGLAAGGEDDLHLTARFLHEGDDESSDIVLAVLAPSRQAGWSVESLFTPSDLMDALAGTEAEGCYFLACPDTVRDAFTTGLIASGAQAFDDSRDFFTLLLSGMPVEIYRKYALYHCDLAVLPGQAGAAPQLAVLFCGLYEGGDEIPPFVMCFDLLEILCRKRTVYLPEGTEGKEVSSPRILSKELN